MQTFCPARSVQVKPGPHVPQGLRHTPLKQTFPVRQMASVPVGEHGWFTSAISLLHAQMLPVPRERQAGHVPGFSGSQPPWHKPPAQTFPEPHGVAVSQAWHSPGAAMGRQSRAVPDAVHVVGFPPTGLHVVDVQPLH